MYKGLTSIPVHRDSLVGVIEYYVLCLLVVAYVSAWNALV